MPEKKKNIANQIKAIRDSHNLSQDRFGKKIGLTGKTISAYETGRTSPPLKVLEKIVNTYEVAFININKENKAVLKEKIRTIEKELADLTGILERGYS